MFKMKISLMLLLLTIILSFFILTADVEATPQIEGFHSTHPPEKCHDLKFNLIMPSNGFVSGMEIARGIIPLKIEMHPQFKGFGGEDGYSVFISVDYEGEYAEDDIGFGQGNLLNLIFLIDTTKLSNGAHTINVNVIDYHSHRGMILMKVMVDN